MASSPIVPTRFFWHALAVIACSSVFQQEVHGEECPGDPTTNEASTASQIIRTLEGQLIFHNDIRGWFELKLDEPQCGQSSIQLMRIPEKIPPLEILRDCRIRSTGAIDFSPTGYYTLDMFQDVEEIEPVGKCARHAPFRDYSGSKPDKRIRAYRVDMHVNYRGEHPIIFRVSSADRELRPWQAYAGYLLTGGSILYGNCGEGFVIDKVFGTPEAHPEHFDEMGTPSDMVEFDPEGAAASGKWDLHLGYTCVRAP